MTCPVPVSTGNKHTCNSKDALKWAKGYLDRHNLIPNVKQFMEYVTL